MRNENERTSVKGEERMQASNLTLIILTLTSHYIIYRDCVRINADRYDIEKKKRTKRMKKTR